MRNSFEMTAKVEEVMKREKGLLPNVDADSASTYYMMGIPLDLYTLIFTISRISGWTAHILGQYADNKLISVYSPVTILIVLIRRSKLWRRRL